MYVPEIRKQAADLALSLLWAPAGAVFGPEQMSLRKGRIAHLRPPLDSVRRMDETAPVRRIVFVNYQPGAAVNLDLIPRGTALLRIARHSFNYGILGRRGFETLAAVIAGCETYKLAYGDLTAATTMLSSAEFCGASEPAAHVLLPTP